MFKLKQLVPGTECFLTIEDTNTNKKHKVKLLVVNTQNHFPRPNHVHVICLSNKDKVGLLCVGYLYELEENALVSISEVE